MNEHHMSVLPYTDAYVVKVKNEEETIKRHREEPEDTEDERVKRARATPALPTIEESQEEQALPPLPSLFSEAGYSISPELDRACVGYAKAIFRQYVAGNRSHTAFKTINSFPVFAKYDPVTILMEIVKNLIPYLDEIIKDYPSASLNEVIRDGVGTFIPELHTEDMRYHTGLLDIRFNRDRFGTSSFKIIMDMGETSQTKYNEEWPRYKINPKVITVGRFVNALLIARFQQLDAFFYHDINKIRTTRCVLESSMRVGEFARYLAGLGEWDWVKVKSVLRKKT